MMQSAANIDLLFGVQAATPVDDIHTVASILGKFELNLDAPYFIC